MLRILVGLLCALAGIEAEVPAGRAGKVGQEDRRTANLQPLGQSNGKGDGQVTASDDDPRLEGHQRSFRVASLIESKRSRQRRMTEIAHAIAVDLPTVPGGDLPVWLKLQQDAYWLADQKDEAVAALTQRYDALEDTLANHAMVVQAMTEGDAAAALGRFPLAVALYDLAENRAESEEDLVAAVLGRKHLILLRDGYDAVVDYLILVRDRYLDAAPSLQGRAYLELAAEHNRHGHWPEARAVLHETIRLFRETKYAEQAKVYLKDWKLTAGEKSGKSRDGAKRR